MFSCLCLTSKAEAKEPLPICSSTSYCSISSSKFLTNKTKPTSLHFSSTCHCSKKHVCSVVCYMSYNNVCLSWRRRKWRSSRVKKVKNIDDIIRSTSGSKWGGAALGTPHHFRALFYFSFFRSPFPELHFWTLTLPSIPISCLLFLWYASLFEI